MGNKKRWTIEEEKVLIAQVEKNPLNLSLAFRLASELIERTESACIHHYYASIVKGKSKLPKSYMYMTISKKKCYANRKIERNNAKESYIEVKESLWSKIKNLFKFN